MAEDLTPQRERQAAGTPAAAAQPPGDHELFLRPNRDWEPAPHAGRFMLAYGLLGLVLGAGVVALAVGLAHSGGSNAVPWSSWKPSGSGTNEVDQIVQHVSTRYRLPSGRQIVAVIPRSPDVMSPPISTAAVDKQALFPTEQQFNTYPLDSSLLYIFCGVGTKCAIDEGTPTVARARYLRREALELALYTFRYVHGVDSVVTFLPPNLAVNASQRIPSALFFRKDQYAKFVDEPLADTLPGPAGSDVLSTADARRIDNLTYPALYRYQLERSSDGSSGVLIFSPLAS